MGNGDTVKKWLEIANDDYYAASILYGTEHRKPLEVVCYHCQQSIEKSLKAYLCAKGVEIPKTHDLTMLCRRCKDLIVSVSLLDVISHPASRRTAIMGCRCTGATSRKVMLPPLAATAAMYDAVTMRSGITRYSASRKPLTPSILIKSVPAPLILQPIALR